MAAVDLDLGFDLPSAVQADIVAVLRAHHPECGRGDGGDVLRSITRDEAHMALAESVRLPFWPEVRAFADAGLLERFEASMLRRGMAVPVREWDGQITVAVANPFNTIGIDHIQQTCGGLNLAVIVAPTREIASVLERTVADTTVGRGEIDALEAFDPLLDIENFDLAGYHQETIPRLLRDIFHKAAGLGASDIHFKTEQERFYYTLRVGGDLLPPETLDGKLRARIDAFLLSLVRIPREQAVREIGISGRFSLTHASGRKIDCRYERHRAYRGFHVTVRLLDRSAVEPRLGAGSLAFDTATLLHLRRAMEMADGIIVLSGPTGSGKSTTLNAMLREIARPQYNTLTLENPVEDEIPGVTHCDLRSPEEFSDYIRSFMRSDPDIILMGEVRDGPSARLAVEAAITGHQVFTTIHTPSAGEILDRFEQLGVARADIARTLRLLCAQRLVKTLCPRCAEDEELTGPVADLYNLPKSHVGKFIRRHREDGCDHCLGRGYAGRFAVIEVLPIDREAGERIVRENLSAFGLDRIQREKYGLKSLQDYGLEMLLDGRSDLEAVRDVINLAY